MIRRGTAIVLCLVLAVLCLTAAAATEQTKKVVRVGWYESPFNYKDAFGRRTGYAYEYQRKIAAYTGWEYQYVEGNWIELMDMLRDGRIDLMSDVSYMEERTEYMLYSALPMGNEVYYLFISPENREIIPENKKSMNGKRIGVTRGSYQLELLRQWAENNGVEAEIVETEGSDEDSLKRMIRGEIDAYVTYDTYADPETAVSVWNIGSSELFFAVSKTNAGLLAELNAAMNRIREENKNYNDKLTDKYLKNSTTSLYLNTEEQEWLKNHGTIRVGYQDNYMAFCAADPETGELTGALKDYLEYASRRLENAEIHFEAVAYPTAAAAMEAVKNGDVDCMFPANLSEYESENTGVSMTPSLMRTEMLAVVRNADQKTFLQKGQIRVGVNKGDPNYDLFLKEYFPGWTPVHYPDTPECLRQVAAGNTDCIIVSSYRFSDIARQCDQLHLSTVSTGVELDYSFAVRTGNTMLYSILSRLVTLVPESTVNAALTYYSAGDLQPGLLKTFLQDYLSLTLAVVCAVLQCVVAWMAVRMRKMKRKSAEKSSAD